MISVEVADKLSPAIRHVASRLEGAGRTEASKAMGVEVQFTVVEHLRMLADTRHDTANRLGASPSNFIAGAADAAAADGAVRADADGVTISIRHPVVARAFRDITITPKNAAALTIPIHAIAYNRRASQFPGLFRLGGRGADMGKNILAIKQGDSVLPLFLLVRSVTQRQDRTLMPSDDQINTAAARGLKGYIRQTVREAKLS